MKKFIYIIPLIILAFTMSGGPPQGWYQQFISLPPGSVISDMVFLDSLTGLISTDDGTTNDTNYILKTTNGGDNWFIAYSDFRDFTNLFKLTDSIVYSCAGNTIFKTTDRGNNWVGILGPGGTSSDDIYALNEDTMWVASSVALTGGIFRSTNGGGNWVQINGAMPSRIYFINANTGFYTDASASILFRTTDGGFNWSNVSGATGFKEINFINENTGWKATGNFYSTTDAGQSWEQIELPPKGGFIIFSRVNQFSTLNLDTIWGVGSLAFLGPGQARGIIYLTTDGGSTWGYQLPDTSINAPIYSHIEFPNKLNGWAYWNSGGIHTVTGGDTTYYFTTVNQIGQEIPGGYELYQNYPNPFNPLTKIKYELRKGSSVKMVVFDITGREISVPIDHRQSAGIYELEFSSSEYGRVLSSGIYFYSLFIDNKIIDTKKMMLVK